MTTDHARGRYLASALATQHHAQARHYAAHPLDSQWYTPDDCALRSTLHTFHAHLAMRYGTLSHDLAVCLPDEHADPTWLWADKPVCGRVLTALDQTVACATRATAQRQWNDACGK